MKPSSIRATTLVFVRATAVAFALWSAVGLAGCSSGSGNTGAAGATGSGTAGAHGAAGSAGTGAAGSSGDTAGTSGAAGTNGNTAGANGNAGTSGNTAGTNGSAGTSGAAGHAGTSGAAGRAGTAGTNGAGGGGRAGTSGGAGTTGIAGTSGTAGTGGQTSCPGESYDAASPPTTLTLSGNLGAHDPAAYVLGSTIYLAATGLIGKTSTNLTTWTATASPLPLPAWAATATGATNLWAPDISFFGGVYHLYYAASTFGSNKSCIGQATRAALDSGSWADQGMVLCSNMGETDNWNAIDPNVVVDDDGTPWLEFGSFWSGLKMVKLTSTGARADTTLYSLANGANSRGSLEGGWVFKRCGYYYLFSSWGSCCSSPYDYNIRVGRSTTVTGPYVDMAGTSLMSGGGTLLVTGNSSWVAPGHNAVITYNNKTYNLYHALQGSSSGPATLRIAEIAWDANGWPYSGGP
jgi:arabinan endo-1,5-alpha-L-arabinosidase